MYSNITIDENNEFEAIETMDGKEFYEIIKGEAHCIELMEKQRTAAEKTAKASASKSKAKASKSEEKPAAKKSRAKKTESVQSEKKQ